MGAVHAVEASASAHAVAGKATTAGRTGGATPSHGDRDNLTGAEAKSLPWYAATVPVDDLGVRVFPPAPSPGVHPRVLCTAAEVPAFMAAIHHTPFGAAVSAPILQAALKEFRAYAARLLAAIPPCDREHPPATAVRSWWTADERRASTLTLAAVAALSTGDEEALDLLVEVLVLYCRLTLAAAALAAAAPAGGDLEKPLSLWRTTKWDLGWGWALGGMATPLLYDWLHHRLSAGQARVVRTAIAAGTRGRRSWGMGLPGTRIQSNWATYHGHLALFCSAIEGEGTPEDEDMLDVNVDTLFSQLTADYVEYAIHDSGHPIEDAYAVNLGFREGSFALLALARRGTNLFRHSKYLALWQQVLPHLLEPRPGGVTGLLGGSSGNAWQYLTSVVVAKWVMPREPLVDWAYALLSGATRVAGDSGTVVYPGLKAKWQVRTEVALLGSSVWADAANPTPKDVGDAEKVRGQKAVGVMPPLPSGVTLPLTWYDPRRGKLVTRSSWSGTPTLLVLDARTEAYLVGHDTPDRGAIIFSAGGRRWVVHNEWRHFHAHEDFSGVAVDGVGQVAKAPSGRWVSAGNCPTLTYAAVDVTYAHNWTWTQWAGSSSPGLGWEPDVSAPGDFLPTGVRPAHWLPPSLFGHPDVAFEGLYQWRRRIGGGWEPVDGITNKGGSGGGGANTSVGSRNRMARVTRTAALVRPRQGAASAARAYGLLVDAVVVGPAAAVPPGGGGHVVTWRLSLAPDVVLLDAPGGGDVLLGEESGDRRLLVRFLPWPVGALGGAGGGSGGLPATAGLNVRLDSYASDLGGGGPHLAKRLVVTRTLAPREAAGVANVASASGLGGAAATVGGGLGAVAGDGDAARAATDAHFVVLLYPHAAGEALPATDWVTEDGPPAGGVTPGGEADADGGVACGILCVAEGGGEERRYLRFGRGGGGETVVSDMLV